MNKWNSYDEEDKFNSRDKINRPRTKSRPKYEDALIARIIAVERGRYTAIINENSSEERHITAVRAKELREKTIVPGDFAYLVGNNGSEGSLARLVKIQKRRNVLRKKNNNFGNSNNILVANIDQLVIVTSTKNPKPHIELIDRIIMASITANIRPIICITKTDLLSSKNIQEYYKSLNIKILESSMSNGIVEKSSLKKLNMILDSKISAVTGLSGVGKSTLINSLTGSDRKISEVSKKNGRGQHTSSSSCAIKLAKSGWIIDTPGLGSIGLSCMSISDIEYCFPELTNIISKCKKGCTHDDNLIECAINCFIEQK